MGFAGKIEWTSNLSKQNSDGTISVGKINRKHVSDRIKDYFSFACDPDVRVNTLTDKRGLYLTTQ